LKTLVHGSTSIVLSVSAGAIAGDVCDMLRIVKMFK
jgi:hypothetical protein